MFTKTLILLAILAAATTTSYSGPRKTSRPPKEQASSPIVTTPLGKIQGTTMISRLGRTIYSFRGIRYAKPPINELRFKPPVPVDRYEGIYNATTDRVICPQFQSGSNAPVSEDCLFLNVYSTKLPSLSNETVKRPVIIHIHAGGFYAVGSVSYWAGPQYFLDQDIVLVTFNWRLGTLGFLSTGEAEAPGNNGLKDQVQALKWVQQNIAAFGGDPNSVTLLGYSAGSISSILHMLSPMSKGLFHKVIAMSASPTAQWPIPNNLTEIAKKQARIVGCPDDTNKKIIDCLKNVSAIDLGNSLPQFQEFYYTPILIWRPVVENDFGQERFLTDHPIKLISEGKFHKVPVVLGVTTDEFDYIGLDVINNQTLVDEMNQNWEKIAPLTFQYDPSAAVSSGLKKFYLNDKPVDRSQLTNLGDLYADSVIGFGVNRAAKLLSAKNTKPVYYYKFSYQGDYSHYYTSDSNFTKPFGVVHHDDLIYLFYVSTLFPRFNETSPKEVEMVDKLTTLHYNFAKCGNPIPNPTANLDNVKWEPFTNETQKYMDIGKTLEMKERLYEDRYSAWEKLFPLDQYLQ